MTDSSRITASVPNTTALALNETFTFDVSQQDKFFTKKYGKADQVTIVVLQVRDVSVRLDGDPRRRYDFSGAGTFVLNKENDAQEFFSIVLTNIDDADTIDANKIRVTFQRVKPPNVFGV